MKKISKSWLGTPPVPEAIRVAPNATLRSAVFSSIDFGKTERPSYIKPTFLCAQSGYTISQRVGQQLDQADLDVWLHLLNLAVQQHPTGPLLEALPVVFSAKPFLRAVAKSDGGTDQEWLADSIKRLGDNRYEIKVTHPDGTACEYRGGLVLTEATRTKVGRQTEWRVLLNTHLAKLVTDDGWTGINLDTRRALKRNKLAQWLHGFYQTHKTPLPVSLASIQSMSGRAAQRAKRFREALDVAIPALAAATGWNVFINEKTSALHVHKSAKPAPIVAGAAPAPTPAVPPSDGDELDI